MNGEISVELLDHMGDDLAVANAARVSFHKESDWEPGVVYKDYQVEPCLKASDAKLICYLSRNGHWTPFAHTAVKLRVSAPIFLARQLFKHKVGLVENEVSRRYVSDAPEFHVPTIWRAKADNVKQGSSLDAVETVVDRFGRSIRPHQLYREALDFCADAYLIMIDQGICPEQARMVLPLSTMTEWIWTGSVASFARVFKQRIHPHAQLEAQYLAKLIGDLVEPLFPVSWSALAHAGP